MVKLALGTLFTTALLASSFSVNAQDAARGAQLYKSNNCLMCHGEQGQGVEKHLGPRIGGQHDWYLLTSLNAFKARERKNPEMYPYIQNLSEADFKDLAAHISSLSGME